MVANEAWVFWNPADPKERETPARYVLENIDEIAEICKTAEEILIQVPPWRDPAFDAYVGGDKDRVVAQVRALFECLQQVRPKKGKYLTYRVEPPDSKREEQRFRLVREVLFWGHGGCLDLALLCAACLLHVGLNPLLIFLRKAATDGFHVILGYWISEQEFAEPVVYGANVLNRIQKEIRVFNGTRIVIDENGRMPSLQTAEEEAEGYLLFSEDTGWEIDFALDLRAARNAGVESIRPLKPCATNHQLPPADCFQSRPELKRLHQFWRDEGMTSLLVLVGIGGAGKTALVRHFLAQLPRSEVTAADVREDKWLPVPDACFVWSFYNHPDPVSCATALYNYLTGEKSTKASFEQVQQLLDNCWRGCRVLLVFDGMENLQVAPGIEPEWEGGTFGQFLPEGAPIARFLSWLCDSPRPISLIATSRFTLSDLRRYETGGSYAVVHVDKLPAKAARALLRARGVRGTDQLLDGLTHEFGNHAQTIDLLGNVLRLFCGGDPARARELPSFEDVRHLADARDQAWGRLRVLRFYEESLPSEELAVLKHLCLFHILPVSVELLANTFLGKAKPRFSGARGRQALRAYLLMLCHEYRLVYGEPSKVPRSFTVHRAVREYFYARIDDQVSLHDGLRKHLLTITASGKYSKPRSQKKLDLLEELIYHCIRSRREVEAFHVYEKKMGGYAYLATRPDGCSRGKRVLSLFFDKETQTLAPDLRPTKRVSLLNDYGGFCRNVGDLPSAVDAFELALKLVRSRDKKNTSIALRNLPSVFLLLGRLTRGEARVAEAIHYAERIKDSRAKLISYGLSARFHTLMGNVERASDHFQGAMDGQEEDLAVTPSLRGLLVVWYADLFLRQGKLGDTERAANSHRRRAKSRGGIATPRCTLLIAESRRLQGDHDGARKAVQSALKKGLETGDNEILVWARLIEARLGLDMHDPTSAELAVREGIRTAGYCGYGLYLIDLVVLRGHIQLRWGDIHQAKQDAVRALGNKRKERLTPSLPHERESQPVMVGARHPQCGYAWGEADALHLLGAILLQQRRKEAQKVLLECVALRRRIQDHKISETHELLARLKCGD